ncbi:MAG TPA: 2OG-Fe(II) oxygenase [Anaerolineae bacterium]|nr:2OG-Fe(II) oxygenase [Anaerolineae bacterium]
MIAEIEQTAVGPDMGVVMTGLQVDGWAVVPHFVPEAEVSVLVAECREEWHEGAFHQAKIGQGVQQKLHSEQRQDYICWLDEGRLTAAQARYWGQLEGMRTAVNQTFFAGLFSWEAHFAIYPPEARYQKHLDQFRGDDTRLLTVILYLNEGWTADDGGQLRLYLEDDGYVDVVPSGGTLVAFWSARFYHEVLPARRERMSITGWGRRRSGF